MNTKLTVTEAAKYLNVTEPYIYILIKKGRLPSVKMDTRDGVHYQYFIDPEDLDNYIATRRPRVSRSTGVEKTASKHRPHKIPDKVFISTPMAGKSDFEILAMLQRTAEEGDENGFAPKDNYTSGYTDANPPKNYKHPQLWYLGKSLIKMADCDEVVFTEGWEKARGCVIERLVYDFYFKGYFDTMIADIMRGENDAKLIERITKKK